MCGFWLLALFDDHWPTNSNSNVRMNCCYSFNPIYCIILYFILFYFYLSNLYFSFSFSFLLCLSVCLFAIYSILFYQSLSVCLSCSLYWLKLTDELFYSIDVFCSFSFLSMYWKIPLLFPLLRFFN